MTILKYVLMVLFVLVCIIATVLVLMQEGRSQGLGAIAGAAETYRTIYIVSKVSNRDSIEALRYNY